MKLQCNNEDCMKVWDYKGKAKHYATCPDCKKSIKIGKSRPISHAKPKKHDSTGEMDDPELQYTGDEKYWSVFDEG